MSDKTKVDGFEVLTLDGREITESEAIKLGYPQNDQIRKKVNGPHHNALWARHRRERRCLQHAFTLPRVPKKGQECVT